ncbi:hypothetical protein B0J18DRAFT_41140 [Chaetomium sp. MPI-SDFR-AT-0129]|uniref:Hikeshi-like domain-containing protein n=1 Tax=Dichotomopilus funicola TaxID=1934379 RepID=A0AAN6ZRQ0_9PEZI|nr:hypothetical protein B0J18DRAFT_41140 [Chaetomium sp. MPI-SDFR-AT-0129]KAK4146706.1 hypothetical protein C8A04DRAFT_34611 [Dichotomopilus funicola]
MSQPLFGLVPAGRPVLTVPTETPSETSFLYAIAPAPTPPNASSSSGPAGFSHIVVFLLPGVVLPPGTAAAIYLVTPPSTPGQTQPDFKFLGAIGEGKESAIFKLGGNGALGGGRGGEGNVVIGISVEDAGSVGARMAELSSSAASSGTGNSGALVPVAPGSRGVGQQPSTLVLAQRIIKNAFNFLSSFSGTAGQVEVVPLKAFEEWWRKFEGRVKSDPGFLERDD